ncbi:MAG: CBS domain-containing protein [archaeon GB-1867-005]|nr:CBS domain-containing protein [Candidatus Culexmicrobium cathedralense]
MEKQDLNKLKDLERILVKDIMRPVHGGVIDDGTPIVNVLELMASEPRRRVFYVVRDGRLIGIITPRRLLEFIALKVGKTDVLKREGEAIGLRFLIGTTAKDYVGELVSVKPDDSIAEACRKMVEKIMDEIPVITDNGKLIGELSFIDVLNLALQKIKKKPS